MPTNCDKSESAPAAALVSFTGSSGCNWARTCNSICASSGSGCAVNIVSTNSRYARGVGTRPADALGLDAGGAGSVAKRWRRPRSEPEYTERRSDAVQAAEKCAKYPEDQPQSSS